MSAPELSPVLERQLLLQLGDRLKALRQAQGLGTVEMAARAGVTRNTLRAVEAGDPGTSIGNVLRVMSVLGVSGDLALLVGDHGRLVAPSTAAGRTTKAAPRVQVRVALDTAAHRREDLQSLALHEEAVRRAKASPELVAQAQATVDQWLLRGDVRTAPLWREWQQVLAAKAWRRVLGRSRHAQQLRQASPLVTVLPDAVRQDILAQLKALQRGVEWGGEQPEGPASHDLQEHAQPTGGAR